MLQTRERLSLCLLHLITPHRYYDNICMYEVFPPTLDLIIIYLRRKFVLPFVSESNYPHNDDDNDNNKSGCHAAIQPVTVE